MARQKRDINGPGSSQTVRISVPVGDTTVLNWLGAQYSISASVRELIRNSVREHGVVDVTCLKVEQELPIKGPGRPRGSTKDNVQESISVATTAENIDTSTVNKPLTGSQSTQSVQAPQSIKQVPQQQVQIQVPSQVTSVSEQQVTTSQNSQKSAVDNANDALNQLFSSGLIV